MDDLVKQLQALCHKHGCLPGEDRIAWLDHELTVLTTLKPPDIGKTYTIEHDGFIGKVIGGYYTIEGKHGVVLQQVGTRVVHVYGRKWLKKVD